MSSLRQNLVLPVAQNLLASIVGAGSVLAYSYVTLFWNPCSDLVIADAERGERALMSGSSIDAMEIANDIVTESPKCSCGYQLRASVSLQFMQNFKLNGENAKSQLYRRICFESTSIAIAMSKRTPYLSAMEKTCKA